MIDLIQPEVSSKIQLGASFAAGERVFYVVVEVMSMKNKSGTIFGAELCPIALVVLESNSNNNHERTHYVFSLAEEEGEQGEESVRARATGVARGAAAAKTRREIEDLIMNDPSLKEIIPPGSELISSRAIPDES